jgi:hypothetical protein
MNNIPKHLLTTVATCAIGLSLANANPILEEVLQYDVLFTAEYVIQDSKGEYVVRGELRGKVTKSIRDRVKIAARFKMNNHQMVLFKFWKNGSKEFGMETVDKNRELHSWINRKKWHVGMEDLVEAIQKNHEAEQDGNGQPATAPESKPEGSDKPQPEAEGRSR